MNDQQRAKNGDQNSTNDPLTRSNAHSHSNSQLKTLKLSSYRWIIVTLYFLSVVVNGVPYEMCVPITSSLAEIYNTSTSAVTTASTVFMAMHPILSIVAAQSNQNINEVIAKHGWATATNLGVILTILGCAIKVLVNQVGFSIIIVGQVLCGMGRPFILNSQASMAMNWFHPDTRIMIITLLNVFNTLSFVISAQIPGQLFKGYSVQEDALQSYDDGRERMNTLCWLEFFISLSIIPCLFLLRSKPKNFQLKINKVEKKSGMMRVMLRLFKNKNFLLIFVPFSLFFGIMKAYLVIMELLMGPYSYDINDIAGVVSIPLIGGLVAQGGLPYFVNKYKVYALFIRTFLFTAAVVLLGLFFALQSERVIFVYLDITMLAVLIMPTLPVMMDLSCDMISPIEPSFAVGVLYMGSMAFFVMFTYILTYIIGDDKSESRVFLTIIVSSAALMIGFICTLFVKIGGYEPVSVESERHSLVTPIEKGNSIMRGTQSKMSIQYRKSSLFNCSVNNIALIGDAPIIATEEIDEEDEVKEDQ